MNEIYKTVFYDYNSSRKITESECKHLQDEMRNIIPIKIKNLYFIIIKLEIIFNYVDGFSQIVELCYLEKDISGSSIIFEPKLITQCMDL